ncbi:hypothetical protein KI387_005943, partial [Taxus chinensis]
MRRIWVLRVLVLILIVAEADADADADDLKGLLALKTSVEDPLQGLKSWNSNSPNAPCDWRGVSCFHERVWELRLPGLHLQGPLT